MKHTAISSAVPAVVVNIPKKTNQKPLDDKAEKNSRGVREASLSGKTWFKRAGLAGHNQISSSSGIIDLTDLLPCSTCFLMIIC